MNETILCSIYWTTYAVQVSFESVERFLRVVGELLMF